MSKPVTIRFVGDESKFKETTEAVGGRLRDFGKQVEEEGKRAGEGFDRAAEGADNAEGKAQGFASTLTGTKDVMDAAGEIARGNLFDGLVLAGQGAADLAEGLNYTVIPAVKAAAGAFTRQALDTARSAVASTVHAVATKAVTLATWAQTVAQRALNLAMRANPIGIVITIIMLLVGAVILAYKRSETFRKIVQGAFKIVKSAGSAMWEGLKTAFNAIKNAISSVASWIKDRMSDAKAAFSSLLDKVRSIRDGARKALGNLVDFVKGIPEKIKNAIGNLGSLLRDAGKNIINGLINGIKDKIQAVKDTIGKVASTIRNALPFSPAKEGPLAGLGSPETWGQRLAEKYAIGVRRGSGAVRNSAAAMAGGLRPAALGGGIIINANTNANPFEIAREVAWAMRTSGR